MKEIDITQIVVALIGVAGIVISGWLIPYLKSKTTSQNWETLKSWAEIFVNGAEVVIKGVNKGGERRDAVMAQLKDKCRELNITYDEDVIRAMLETEWKRMKESEVLTHPLLEEIK